MRKLSQFSISLSMLLVVCLALFSLVACEGSDSEGLAAHEATTQEAEAGTGTRIITDSVDREIEIPEQVDSVIALGVGAPRIATYLDVVDMLIGAEEVDQEEVTVLRDYNPIHNELFKTLPTVGQGGGSGNNNAFPEEIIMLAPDVIIAGFDYEAAEELQAQTGIPVVSVRHSTGLASETFIRAVRVFAEIVGAEERGEELLSTIASMKADLEARTADVADSDKLSVYAGAVTWNGRRGFGGTYAHFGPLDAINALNVADDSGLDGFFEADFEKIVVWDPDVIFLDPGNMDLVNDEYRANPSYFNSLRAVQEGRVYTMPAFNFSGTNITYAFINAYYAGTVLFPEEFADVDIETKAGEILTEFLGENTFEQMREGGLFYGTIEIGQ